MLGHIFINRLKCIIRDKGLIFWTLIFPMVLGTFFYMAFSNLDSEGAFKTISIGVVDNAAYNGNQNFKNALSSASQGEQKLFAVHTGSREQLDEMLDDNKISAYVVVSDKVNMVVKSSGLDQTIVKTFLDEYTQTSSTIRNIMSANPSADVGSLIQKASESKTMVRDIPIGKKPKPSQVVTFFYSLIAMACMYGSYFGLKEIIDIQADLSKRAARLNVSPANKLKMLIGGMSAAFLVQFAEILLLLSYLVFVLKIDFGNQIGYIVLTCFTACLTGLTFGAFISAMVKKNHGIKGAILIGGTMVASFLAGMMVPDIKYIIQKNVPLLSYINPVALITDAFYALYYFDSHNRFFLNIGLLGCLTVLFGTMTFLVIRRHKYESI
ncbi:MAG TPA: ABC transporter permease [Ruminiclostridium sp.]|nr:ABC transporter permease [Ruminiclostridium sp.]